MTDSTMQFTLTKQIVSQNNDAYVGVPLAIGNYGLHHQTVENGMNGQFVANGVAPALVSLRVPRRIKFSTNLIFPVETDLEEILATVCPDLPNNDVMVTKRSFLRRLGYIVYNSTANEDNVYADISKSNGKIIFQVSEIGISREGFGIPFEKMMTNDAGRPPNQDSFHVINVFNGFAGIDVVVTSELDARDSSGRNVEIKQQKNNRNKKTNQPFPISKEKIRTDSFYNSQFQDKATQMYFGNAQTLKMGIVVQDMGAGTEADGAVTDIFDWTFQEVCNKGFPCNTMKNMLGKLSFVLKWVADSLAAHSACKATFEYSKERKLFTLTIQPPTDIDEITNGVKSMEVKEQTTDDSPPLPKTVFQVPILEVNEEEK